MGVLILNSNWEVQDGQLPVERNMHKEIREEILSIDPEMEVYVNAIEKAFSALKEKGIDAVYSIKLETSIV